MTGFFWLCPCGSKNFYKGGLTTEAVTTCKVCKRKSRIYKYKIVAITTDKPPETTPKPQTIEYNGSVQSLIIALTYAINTVKNKKQVKAKDINSTWFQHYRSWTRMRDYFQKLEEGNDGKFNKETQ